MNNKNTIDTIKQRLLDNGISDAFALFFTEKKYPRRKYSTTQIIGRDLAKQLLCCKLSHTILTTKETQQIASILWFDLQKDIRLLLQQHGLNDSVDILRSSKIGSCWWQEIAGGLINQFHINLLLNDGKSKLRRKLTVSRILEFIEWLWFNLYEDIKNKVEQEKSTYTSVLMSMFPGGGSVLETFKKRYWETSEYSFLRKHIILELIKDIKFRWITLDIFISRSREILQSTAEGDLWLSNMNLYKRLHWILGYPISSGLSLKVKKDFANVWKNYSYPYV